MSQRTRVGIVALALASAALGVTVSSGSASQEVPDSAKSIARLLDDRYHNVQSLRAVFLERYSEGPRETRIESGTVYFRRPGRMRWDYDSPEKKLFIADGKTVWFYVPADHTVTKAPVKESSDWRTPLALLTGKADLSRLCSHVDVITQKGTAAGHVVLRCLPRGEKDPSSAKGTSSLADSTQLPGAGDFIDVLLEVDSANGDLASVRVRQAGGIELEYRFGDWQRGISLPDEMFQFHPPTGVAIVDGSALNNASH